MTSTNTVMPMAQPVSSFKMIRTVAGVSIMSGFMILAVVKATEARIENNKRVALADAVMAVLPDADTNKTFEVTGDGFRLVDTPVPGADRVYAGYDAEGRFVGAAFEAAAQGYQDVVRTLFGYSPERDCIIGFKVLESKETPGLGDRIGKDAEFLANFDGLDVALGADQTALAHAIAFVKRGEKTNPWEIDGITGATISSRAVAKMANERSQQVVPFIKRHLDQLKEGT